MTRPTNPTAPPCPHCGYPRMHSHGQHRWKCPECGKGAPKSGKGHGGARSGAGRKVNATTDPTP